MARRFTFSRSRTLRKAADFDRVHSEGKRVAGSSLVLIFCPSPWENTRLGISVSKKIGKAVVRNRVKRLLREAFRLNRHRLKKAHDVLVIARQGVQELKFREVEERLLDLFRRGGLFVQEGETPRENGLSGIKG